MPNDDGVRLALLTDSQATLRQVRGVLSDFATAPDAPVFGVDRAAGELADNAEAVTVLLQLVTETRSEITEVIAGLRRGRELLGGDAGPSPTSGSGSASELLVELEARMVRLLQQLSR